MDARTYLERVSKIDKLIENKSIEMLQWQSIAEGMSSSGSGERVQTSVTLHKMESAAIRVVEIEEEIKLLIEKYIDAKQEIVKTIEMINDATMYDILHKKYIQGMQFEEIGTACNYSRETIKWKHKKALKIIQGILNEREKNG